MELKKKIVWAVGIEDTFIAQTAKGERILDEFELIQHYQFWQQDLDLARELGATMIRYGIPWYKIEPEPGHYDWTWVDRVMEYFQSHPELTPIIDFMHYGTPIWMKSEFLNEDYPDAVVRYATAFVERYKHVTSYYTPLNEPFINAEWCGWSGTWPPYLTGHSGFASIMKQLCKGIVKTVHAIKSIQPEAIMVHVEASKKYVPGDQTMVSETSWWNEFRFIMWEMVVGKISNDHSLYNWAIKNGISVQELNWFRKNAIELDIIGVNYYPQFSVNKITKDVVENAQIPEIVPGSVDDLIDIARDLSMRYKKPIFITETSYRGTVEDRVKWLDELVEACSQMKENEIELFGITWFPFIDMIDWPYRTNGKALKDNMARFGLYTLEEQEDGTLLRVKNAAAKRFEDYVKNPMEGI